MYNKVYIIQVYFICNYFLNSSVNNAHECKLHWLLFRKEEDNNFITEDYITELIIYANLHVWFMLECFYSEPWEY